MGVDEAGRCRYVLGRRHVRRGRRRRVRRDGPIHVDGGPYVDADLDHADPLRPLGPGVIFPVGSLVGRHRAYLKEAAACVAGRWVTIERVEAYVLRVHGRRVSRTTIRSWTARGHVQSREDNGKVWYELASVERYVTGPGRKGA